MQGLITLDFGNSHPHAGLFKKINHQWTFVKSVPLRDLNRESIDLDFSPHNSQIVLSEVKKYDDFLTDLTKQGYLITSLKDYWKGDRFFGMPVHYAKSLGQDRLIQAFYTFKKIKSPTILIDAGTFTTIDIITSEGFLGGYIIPNYEAYFSLFKSGENLKNINLESTVLKNLPQNTESALSYGYTAFFELVNQMISRHRIQNIILTGGKFDIWKNLNTDIGYINRPYYIHESIQYWMTTQIELL